MGSSSRNPEPPDLRYLLHPGLNSVRDAKIGSAVRYFEINVEEVVQLLKRTEV